MRAALLLPLDIRVDHQQQRRPCQALGIVDLTAKMGQRRNPCFAEALRCIHAVEHDAGVLVDGR